MKKSEWNDGLWENFIYDIVVDKNGVLWFGGDERLYSFDGNSWNYYTYNRKSYYDGTRWIQEESENYPYDRFFDLEIDDNNTLWIASERGLYKHNSGDWTHYTWEDGLVNTYVNCIAIDPNNSIWCGTTKGITVFKHQSKSSSMSVVSPNGFESIRSNFKHTITWKSFGADYIHLEYSVDDGETWDTIAENVDADLQGICLDRPGYSFHKM